MHCFANQVIWITGATSGYGLALAQALANVGAKLIISGRDERKVDQVVAQLPDAKGLTFDLMEREPLKHVVQQAINRYGHIDRVIHNAAIGQCSSALETDLDKARTIMEVDYFAQTELTYWLLPHFIARQQGHFIVISGVLARLNLPTRTSYAAAKAALIAYFGCLRAEVSRENIDVTVIIPGSMQTEFVRKAQANQSPTMASATPVAGCAPEEAARQTLEAIKNREYECYVGLFDDNYSLFQLTQKEANQGIQRLLEKLAAARAQ